MGAAMQLADLLPTDAVLPFLQQYPNLFEVTMTGEYTRKSKPTLACTVRANTDDGLLLAAAAVGGGSGTGGVAPGVGGSSSSGASSSPAVGGGSRIG